MCSSDLAAEDLPGGAEAGAAPLREAEARALLSFFYIVVNGPEDGSPALTTRVPVRVSDGALQQAFQWLAASQKRRLPDPLM